MRRVEAFGRGAVEEMEERPGPSGIWRMCDWVDMGLG